jgi:DNA polymerase elongation subunit (family B)
MEIISDMTVGQAHPYLSATKQGALVGCFKPGLYKGKGLRKFDVISYYPNLDRTLNLSPETCRIVRIDEELLPYTAKMDHDTEILTLSIPDDKAKRQVIIEIDFARRGFTSSFVDKAMTDRLEMKQKMKTLSHDSPEYASLDVNQLNLKVIMNSITGYFGMEFAAYGSLASYIAITGTGRYLISKLIEHVESTVALDTDGIVINSDEDIDETNAWLEKYILEFFKVPKNYIQLEEEHFEAAYFRDGSKQYLLLERDKQNNPHLVIHGISFKGSNLPKIFSSIIEEFGLQMLLVDENDKSAMREFEEAIAKHYDKDNWNLEIIKKRIKVKPIEQYASSGTIGGQLGVQYQKRFDIAITNPTQLDYVKVKRPHGSTYQLVTIFDSFDGIDGIDYKYYEEIVDSAFDRLGLLDHIPRMKRAGRQKNLFDFSEPGVNPLVSSPKKKKSKKSKK